MIRTRLSNRPAYTLIEMVVVMSVSVVILTISVSYLHRIMSISSRSAKFLQAEQTALQFSRQFRLDAMLAASADVSGQAGEQGGVVLLLKRPEGIGGNVEYRFSTTQATRTMQVDSGSVSRQQYRFPEGTRWDLKIVESPTRVLLVSTNDWPESSALESGPPPAWRVPFEMDIEATLGRLTRSSGGTIDEPEPEGNE